MFVEIDTRVRFLPSFQQAQRVCGASGMPKAKGTLLYTMVSRLKDSKRLQFLTDCVVGDIVCSEQQLSGKLTCEGSAET